MTTSTNLMESLGFRTTTLGVDTLAVLGNPGSTPEGGSPTIEWAPPWPSIYPAQTDLLFIRVDGVRYVLPEVVLVTSGLLGELEDNAGRALAVGTRPGAFKTAEAERHPAVLAALAEGKARGAKVWDGQDHARLLVWDAGGPWLVFQRSTYFSYLATNLGLDATVDGLEPLRTRDRRHSIHPLNTAPFANITGVNVLAFSNDGHALLVRRGQKVLVRPDQLSATWSGTLAWDDLDVDPTDATRTRFELRSPKAMARWLSASGVSPDRLGAVHFLGLTRELIRGGIPSLYYAVTLNLSAAEWVSGTARRLDIDGERVAVDFGAFGAPRPTDASSLPAFLPTLLEGVRTGGGAPLSVPLLTQLTLWYGELHPGEVATTTVVSAASTDTRASQVGSRRWNALKLKDFLCFADAEVEFGPGINLVVGDNAAGKSHLLQVLYTLDRLFDGTPVPTRATARTQVVSPEGCVLHVFGNMQSLVRKGANGGWFVDAEYSDDNGPGRARLGWDGSTRAPERAGGRREGGPVFLPAHDFLKYRRHLQDALDIPGMGLEHDFDKLVYRNRVPRGPGTPEIEAVLGGRRLALDEEGQPQLVGGAGALSWDRTADGWKRLATLSMLLSNELPPGSVLYWDEPDDAINPKLFPVLGDRLVNLVRKGVQVFVATHSLALVRWLHMRAVEPSGGAPVPIAFVFLTKNADNTTQVSSSSDLYDQRTGMVASEEAWDREVIKRQARKYAPKLGT